ncbi:LamG domain-containing protein [Streptomyces sp. MS19]|uniref:LamG domain-containing protein n=1 Tax=Streptomyces sp. MS19 TaxID=3385972 RepID=UPI0039A033DA
MTKQGTGGDAAGVRGAARRAGARRPGGGRHGGTGGGATGPDRSRPDEAAGASATPAAVPARWANLAGTATLGAPGTTGTALHLDGATGYAATTAAVVDTSRSFTVSAWARLDAEPGQDAVVVTQTGRRQAGFELSWSAADGGWSFAQYDGEGAGARVTQPDGQAAAKDTWTHLVGVHDAYAGTLTLYVDGERAARSPSTPRSRRTAPSSSARATPAGPRVPSSPAPSTTSASGTAW